MPTPYDPNEDAISQSRDPNPISGPDAAVAAHDEYVMPVEGFKGTPEEIERQWFEQCFKGRGDTMWQLTWRAVIMGSLLGGVLSLTNLYIGLKAGWGFGVAITACILSYAIWTAMYKIGLVRTQMTVLENNCMQSTASSAGYSTGGTLVSAFAAYILLNDTTLPYWMLMGWVFFLAVLGVTMAIPMKRQMINVEQLRFPSGIAAAETLKALHSTGDKGIRSAKALGIAGLFAAIFAFWNEIGSVVPRLGKYALSTIMEPVNKVVFGGLSVFSVHLVWDPIFMAAGIFTGMRVCLSMLVAGTLCWAVFCPIMLNKGHIRLTVDEDVPTLPMGLDFQTLTESKAIVLEPDEALKFKSQGSRRFIRFNGVMTPEQRDVLLAQSDDLLYQNAIQRLYVRSQYRASAPLAQLPKGVDFDTDLLRDVVSFHSGPGLLQGPIGLVADDIWTSEQYAALEAMSDDPAYRAALAALRDRAMYPTVEPLWASVGGIAIPPDLKVPAALKRRLHIVEEVAKTDLAWRGPLGEKLVENLQKLSDNPEFSEHLGLLHNRSLIWFAAYLQKLPKGVELEPFKDVIHYDPVHGLVADDWIPAEVFGQLRLLSADREWVDAVDALQQRLGGELDGTRELTVATQLSVDDVKAIPDEFAARFRVVPLETDKQPQGLIVRWRGPMSAADRDALHALSGDAEFSAAIDQLYARAPREAVIALRKLPSALPLPTEPADLLTYDPQRGLIAQRLMTDEEFDALHAPTLGSAFKNDPDVRAYRQALEALHDRFGVELTPQSLGAVVELPVLPTLPKTLVERLSTGAKPVAKRGAIAWEGAIDEATLQDLLAMSPDPAFQLAVYRLADAAAHRALSDVEGLPPELEGLVTYDAAHAALVASAPLPERAVFALDNWSDRVGFCEAAQGVAARAVSERAAPNFRDLVGLSLWAGTACMVTSGLLAFALQWKSALRAFSSLGKMFKKKATEESSIQEQMDAIETPGSWFVAAQVISLIAIAWLAKETFDMPYWQSALAVVLSFALALVACRVTGETDTTPVGAMGKIMQLTFGGISPASSVGSATKAMNINLMAANITAAAAGGSADLLTDLKSGYLLGAHPRKQFLAQASGIFIGTVVTVSSFSIMVPRSDVLGSDQFPAPAALTWSAVAEALSVGLNELSAVKIWCIVIGGLVGILIPLLATLFPKQAKYMPSAAGIGLAWTFHWYYSLMFFLGACIGLIWQKTAPKHSEEFSFPIASGVVAGGALMGVALIFIENGPEMFKQIFGG